MAPAGSGDILQTADSNNRWQSLREQGGLVTAAGEVCFRIVIPPSRASETLSQLSEIGLRRWSVDWAGGLLWAVLPQTYSASAIHTIKAGAAGVAARLGTGPEDANREAFTPLPAGVVRLNGKLRRSLDPQSIFNPGRFSA